MTKNQFLDRVYEDIKQDDVFPIEKLKLMSEDFLKQKMEGLPD